jgi:hypothetical protein
MAPLSTAHAMMAMSIAFLATACRGCPTSESPESRANWQAELTAKPLLALDPKKEITIKRDVHNVIVDVDAATFAAAFHDVMRDPARRFGLIRVDRLPQYRGKPFTMGEKFQGRYSIGAAIEKGLPDRLKRLFGEFADDRHVKEWLCRIENDNTSDYGMITQLDLEPPPGRAHVLRYEYLAGSPIAGSSTFVVRDILDEATLLRLGVSRASRLEQIFEYQEQSESFATFFSKGGLKLHNQVVWSQAEQSAAAAGGRVLRTDIPNEYRQL